MSDKVYIEKEAAENVVCKHCPDREDGMYNCWCARIGDIESLPPAYVKPVVRCKDCKYHTACLMRPTGVNPSDWYCADGERRAE